MRLGKSFCLIRWAQRRAADGRKLVVAPLSVLPGWVEELAAEGLPSVLLVGSSKRKLELLDSAPSNSWCLLNPEGLRSCRPLAYQPWTVVALDESTFIKNPTAKITKLCCTAFKDVKDKAILTGEPRPESDLEVVPQMLFLNGSFMGCDTFWKWRHRHAYQAGFEWRLRRESKERFDRELAKHCFAMTPDEAGIFMPCVRQRRVIELPAAVRGLYNRAIRDWAIGEAETKWTPVVHSWLQQIASGLIPRQFQSDQLFFSPHKFDELVRLLTGELKNEKFVVFFRFNREVALAADRLRRAGVKLHCFTGLSRLRWRHECVRRLRAGRCRGLLLQERCARYGLNLSEADVAIFFDNYPDWETRSQAAARILHPMKKRTSLVLDLVARGTVDEALLQALNEKRRSARALMQRIQQLMKEVAR